MLVVPILVMSQIQPQFNFRWWNRIYHGYKLKNFNTTFVSNAFSLQYSSEYLLVANMGLPVYSHTLRWFWRWSTPSTQPGAKPRIPVRAFYGQIWDLNHLATTVLIIWCAADLFREFQMLYIMHNFTQRLNQPVSIHILKQMKSIYKFLKDNFSKLVELFNVDTKNKCPPLMHY